MKGKRWNSEEKKNHIWTQQPNIQYIHLLNIPSEALPQIKVCTLITASHIPSLSFPFPCPLIGWGWHIPIQITRAMNEHRISFSMEKTDICHIKDLYYNHRWIYHQLIHTYINVYNFLKLAEVTTISMHLINACFVFFYLNLSF